MRKYLSIIICFLFLSATALIADDNTVTVKTWRVASPVAVADTIPTDTSFFNFQDDNRIDRYSIANSYNGNLGSPIQSKLYFIRPQNSTFIFGDAYVPYIMKPENVTFYNTKKPFSYVSAKGGGSTYRAENEVKFLFTANANKRLNFGTNIDFVHAVGEYRSQATKKLTASLFGSYDGDRYSGSGAVILNNLSNHENGGIISPADIHGDGATKDILTRMKSNAMSGYRYNTLFYNHSYSLGFNRTIQVREDSTITQFVPVTRFGHIIKLSDERKRYIETPADTAFYTNTYYSNSYTSDTAAYRSISNTLSVSIEEEFNKWMQFGLTAYISNDVQSFTIMQDSINLNRVTRSRTKVGGVLSKQRGARFRYNINAEFDILGAQAGDFDINANLGGFFKVWKDSVALIAKGFIRNESPSFFQEEYRSNHMRWSNDFKQIFRTHIGGTFSIPTRKFNLDVNVENISNHIYFDSDGYPRQHVGNIQVLALNLKQDFRLGKMHLDNNVVYQVSSNQDILPLPALSLYHNLYYKDMWFKLLSVQFGADVRYNTAYYAPAYMPAIGQFTIQDEEKIGNFPVINLYLNFYLKGVRLYVKGYHINSLFTEANYFSMPNYPINPFVLKLGLAWNFYN
ncbi:putative porin [Paludibacteraceae bacterium OttesenSCG-928-F17]|nr:putative porin [Paludibacteraceae bacterium OttesenSCG-928-F17]